MADYLTFRMRYNSELYHHGIKGQKWGERRFQNPDGTLTKEGIARYRTNVGTKEMLKNTTDYDKLTKKQQKQYTEYGRRAGAKKGAIIGGIAGAGIAVTKTALNFHTDKKAHYRSGVIGNYNEPSGRAIVNKFIRKAVLGAIGGVVVGTIVGGHTGKRKAQAELADKGKNYVNELLETPVDRLHHSDESEDILEMSEIQTDELFLEHHGIKGQKWGIRRYQNEDGSLTPEGMKRYNPGAPDKITRERDKKTGATRYFYKDSSGNEITYKTNIKQLDYDQLVDLNKQVQIENKINKEVADKQVNTARDAKEALDSSARVLDATARALPTGNGKVVKKDYSDLSDQELRNRISRLQLEESYGRLSGETKYIKSGSEKTREILQTAGSIVAIGASAAGLALTINEIKNRRQNAIPASR